DRRRPDEHRAGAFVLIDPRLTLVPLVVAGRVPATAISASGTLDKDSAEIARGPFEHVPPVLSRLAISSGVDGDDEHARNTPVVDMNTHWYLLVWNRSD